MALSERVLKGSVSRALDLIGDRWTLLILLSAFDGTDRFDVWKSRYNISSSILSSRLKHLIDAGMMKKELVTPDSRRLRYVLTDMGEELFPWAVAVWGWERRWVFRGTEHPISLVHTACGHKSSVCVRCNHCKRKATRENVKFEPGPGYFGVTVQAQNKSRRSTASLGDSAVESHIGQSVDVIGDRWSFLILSAAYFGITRFDDFKDQLNIATNVLSDRLKRFTDNGILAKNMYQENPSRFEYILTEKSIEYFRVALMLALWGDKWVKAGSGEAFTREHDLCGKKLSLGIYCTCCGEALGRGDIDFISKPE